MKYDEEEDSSKEDSEEAKGREEVKEEINVEDVDDKCESMSEHNLYSELILLKQRVLKVKESKHLLEFKEIRNNLLFSLKTIFKPEDLKTEESEHVCDEEWQEEEEDKNSEIEEDSSLNDSYQPDFKGGNLDELLREMEEDELLKA
jgi:hypothetical protein